MPEIIRDPFHRALASLLKERLDEIKENLAHGAAARIAEDVATVGEKYALIMGRIESIEYVLQLCHDIETNQETLGPRPAPVKVVER